MPYLIAGNWKMNNTVSQTKSLIKELEAEHVPNALVSVVVSPSFLSLETAVKSAKTLSVSSQNIHWEESGAFTGEVSAKMLTEIGVTHAIIGHSERRQYFAETDETVHLRAKAALKNKITPIVCVGETLEERENGNTHSVVKKQLEGALNSFSSAEISRCVIAYEPVWAIGTGKTASPEQAQDVHAYIRSLLPTDCAKDVPILYGGSMKPANAKELLEQPDIDGGLIGGASLNANDFLSIIRIAQSLT